MSERVRREVRELVNGFGPPSPGLAARAVAGLPDRPTRAGAPWAIAVAAVLAIATAGLLLWTARGVAPRSVPSSHPSPTAIVQTPTTAPQPTPQSTNPAQASAAVRAAVTGAQPVLLPSAVVGANWRAQVTTTSDSFTVRYTDPTGTRQVILGEGREHEPNPALPTAKTTQTHPAFHGDWLSLYQVNDSSDLHSPRILMWHERGAYDQSDSSYPGVPYFIVATGMTDAEFWQLANSLH